MATSPRTFHVGLRLKPDTTGYTLAQSGEMKVDSTLLKIYLDSAIRTLVTTDQSQTLTNKTIVAASNTITTAASGNLAATELNAALAELQGDIDTRALASDLTTHMSDTTTHGTTGNIVGTSDSQTLTNKTIVVLNNTITTAASGNLGATELNAALAELQSDIDTRLTSGALTTHEGDTSTHGVTEIVGTSETQTLTNKTIVAANNTITTAASGNLVATSLNAALAELQGDIDTRALSSDLTTHMSDTTTHGTTGDIVGTSDTQVLTNKDIDGGTAANTRRITLPKDTKANLDALTRKEGTIWFASDEDKAYVDNGSALVAIGSGGTGSPDTIFEINADNYTSVSGWATGDGTIVDGSALPGGTLQGTFELISVSPAEGTKHFRFTQAAGSLDTYFLSDAQTIAEVWRGKDVGCNVSLKYDGADNDLYIIVWDATNNRRLTTTDFYVKASTTYRNHQMVFTIPSSCTSIRVGFQVRALNSGKIINFDKFSLFDRPFVMANVNDQQYITYSAAQNTYQDVTAEHRFPSGLTTASFTGQSILRVEDDAGNTRTKFTANRTCKVHIQYTALMGTAGNELYIYKNGTGTIAARGAALYTASNYTSVVGTVDLVAGDFFTLGSSVALSSTANVAYLGISATAQVESVITPQFKDDSMIQLTGSNGFGSTNTRILRFLNTVENSTNHVTYSDSATLGASFTIVTPGIYNITFTSRPQAAGGTVFGISRNSNQLTTDYTNITTAHQLATAQRGTYGSGENTASATCYLNAGDVIRAHGDSNTAASGSALVSFFITKIGHKSLSSTPVDRVAYLSDVKSSATAGGTFTSGAWQTRTLNTIDGDTSFCSLSSNQFTLSAGTYDIDASAPGYFCAAHKAKLYNVSLATDQILGSSEYAGANTTQSRSIVKGRFTLSSPTVFELRHRCSLTSVSDGFGTTSSFSVSEIYAMVSIKKIK